MYILFKMGDESLNLSELEEVVKTLAPLSAAGNARGISAGEVRGVSVQLTRENGRELTYSLNFGGLGGDWKEYTAEQVRNLDFDKPLKVHKAQQCFKARR